MTLDQFTGVTFNHLDASGIWISRSSQVFVVNSIEIALNTSKKHILQESADHGEDSTHHYYHHQVSLLSHIDKYK